MVRQEQGVEFRVPEPGEEKIRFARVGIVAAVAFVVGIAWPRIFGLTLVAEPPGYEKGQPAAAAENPTPKSEAAPAAKVAPKEEPQTTAEQTVQLGDPLVTSCRTAEGKRLENCDKIDVDEIARDRVTALAGCEAAKGASGILSLGIEFDFSKKRVRRFLKGKSTTLSDGLTKKILACAEKEFESAQVGGIDHQHARYIVFYPVKFVPAGEPVEGEGDLASQETPASGLATVSWEVALVRDAPKEGKVLARLLNGTRVTVKARIDDWYKVKYDAKGNEGWVYRGAIGL